MSEGKFKKWAKKEQKRIGMFNWKIAELSGTPIVYKYKSHAFLLPMGAMMDAVNEARKEFLKDFTDDDIFVLKEYGLEDDGKLTIDAIKLKNEILLRWGKQSAIVFLKWFGNKPS